MHPKHRATKSLNKPIACPCGSGSVFRDCHGKDLAPVIAIEPKSTPTDIVYAAPAVTRKIDLACGQNCREGFEGVDIWPGAPIVHDLSIYPWPFADNSVAEINCSHYVEHIQMEFVDEIGNPVVKGGQDSYLKFFDEVWRILVPDGWATITVPNARSNRAFQDPTHRRFIVAESFLYLSNDWRKLNKLDHYNTKCNFGINVVPIIPIEHNALSPEVQTRKFNGEWNSILDWQAQLKTIK